MCFVLSTKAARLVVQKENGGPRTEPFGVPEVSLVVIVTECCHNDERHMCIVHTSSYATTMSHIL